MELPLSSSPNVPQPYAQAGFPLDPATCGGESMYKARDLIDAYEKGDMTIQDFPCDDSVPGIWQTWGKNGEFVPLPGGEVTRSGQYGFKFLSDRPDDRPYGISTRFGPYDNIPHFHREPEWFYALEGETLLNINGELRPFKKGDIVLFEAGTVHDMVLVKPGKFTHLWGYPFDSDSSSFVYYNRENTREIPEVQAVFDEVDRMRINYGIAPNPMGERPLGKGIVPATQWWEKNNSAS